MSDTPRTDAILDQRFDSVLEGSHACTRLCKELERELAAMTAAKELAERQVAVLCGRLCVLVDCSKCPAKTEGCSTKCDITTAAWSRAEAANAPGKGRELCERTSPPPCSASDVSAKYNELLYAVAQKFPGESRHETALRYIREREQRAGEATAEPCKRESDCSQPE